MTISEISLPAPAKLNLFLHIIGTRPDGYHQLQTIFQLLDVADELTFKRNQSGNITIKSNDHSLETDQNLVVKAAKLLKETFDISLGVDIFLDKKLPMGGGIGGGSSDCATTLLALNELWNIRTSKQELLQLGTQLGADVAVFVNGRTAWAAGIGDELTNLEIPEQWYILIHPKQHVSTPKLFAHPQLTRNTPASTIRADLAQTGHNDFEPLVRSLYPTVEKAFQTCTAFGTARLTGSGSCLFLKVPSLEKAEDIQLKIKDLNPELSSFITKGLNVSPAAQRLKQMYGNKQL